MTNYLTVEAPAGRTFPRLASRADLQQHQLSPDQVMFYRQNGYVQNLQIMTLEQVERLRADLETLVAQKGHSADLSNATGLQDQRSTKLTYMQGAWMLDEAIHDLVFHPSITVKLAQLLDCTRVRFWHDQVFYKPPRTGGNVAWHQDYSYWKRAVPAQHITVWIGLDDSREDNGCLQMIPGSHRWPLLDRTDLTGDMAGLKRQLTPEQLASFKPVALEQPAGTCSFHHDHAVHGSYANRSDRPRRAIVLNYMKDGTRSNADDGVMMPGFKPIPKGEVIQGDWFPLVIDVNALPAGI